MAFEAILSQERAAPSRWRRITLTFSVLVHAIALAAGIVHSVWQVEEMPMPAVEVTLSMAPPPPPPPPPPPKRSSTKAKTKPTDPKPKVLVTPKEVQEKEPEPAEEESSEDEGEEGGVEGGVVGGVVGGIVGGAAPPPPVNAGPKLLTTKAGINLLAINPRVRPYKVNVDEELIERGEVKSATLRICVSAQGTVTSVKILKPSIPVIDTQIPTVIPRWRFKPYVIDGKPTEFCFPMIYTVK
jgi:periplasmic protein TonB